MAKEAARYDAAKAAADALDRAMNGPDGSPAAVRAVLTEHAAALADLAGQTLAKFTKVVGEAPDERLCPSAAADHEDRKFDPFDRSQRWTYWTILGDKAKERLATFRYEASAAALVAIAARLVQRITPGDLPEASLSILALSDLLDAARCSTLALDLGEAFSPRLADGGTTTTDGFGYFSGEARVDAHRVVLLDRAHTKRAVDLVRAQMTRSDPDAVFRARLVWEQVTPVRIVRPDTDMPFALRAMEYTEAVWDALPPASRVQTLRMTIDDTEPADLYGPVQRIPGVYAPRLVLSWDEPPVGRRGGRKGYIRIYGQNEGTRIFALGDTLDLVTATARTTAPAPVKEPSPPVAAPKPAVTKPKRKAANAA